MTEDQVLNAFNETGAMLHGHFVFSYGDHADVFLDGERLSTKPVITHHLCHALSQLFCKDNIEVVVGPGSGGIVLAHGVAHFLFGYTNNRALLSLNVVRNSPHSFAFRRPDDARLVEGKRVLIIDDIATTWGTVVETTELISSASGVVVAGAVVWDRLGNTKPRQILERRVSLLAREVPRWSATVCRERSGRPCHEGVVINTAVGHGAEFVAVHGQPPYMGGRNA